MKRWGRHSGFTIVELLIVVVVIAILAAVTIVAYNGIQERARVSKMRSDVSTIVKAIEAARSVESKTLLSITTQNATGSNCWVKPDGTDLAALPKSDICWVRYYDTLRSISDAAKMDISNLVDPWGRPYLIDENEGENGNCWRDTVSVFKRPFTTGSGYYDGFGGGNVQHSGYTGCS